MKITFTLCIMAVLCLGARAQWQPTNGPEGGYTSHLTKVSDALFVNGQAGGIFKSVDEGLTWQEANNGLPEYAHCYVLTRYNNRLYASIYNNGIYFSEDSGGSWHPINNGVENLTCYAFAVHADDLYAADANGGFFYSDDHGASWSLHEGILKGLRIRNFVISGEKLFAAVSNGDERTGVYLSEDKGMSWTKLSLTTVQINAMSGYDNVLYVSDGALKVSRDYGVSWSTVVSPGQYNMNAIFASGDSVAVGGSSKAVFYSVDEGTTWTSKLSTAPDNHHTSILWNGGKFWLATSTGVYYSDDGGDAWQVRNNGLQNQVVENILADGDTLMVIGAQTGLFASWDGGASWPQLEVTTPEWGITIVTGIYASDQHKVASTFQGTFKTNSVKQAWTQIILPDGNKNISFIAGDGNKVVGVVYSQGLYTSLDGGDVWLFKPVDLLADVAVTTATVKGDTVVLGTDRGLLISKDFGATWTLTSTPPTYFWPKTILFHESSLIVLTGLGLYRTTDLGNTWGRMDDLPLETYPEDMVIADNGNWYAATQFGVYVSYNKGLNWFPVNTDLTSPVASLVFKEDQLFAGTYGRGVWSSLASQLNVRPTVAQQTTDFTITDEETISLTLDNFEITDPDNEALTLVVREGANYSVSGNVITPDPGFVGELIVPVQVDDGAHLSDVFSATVRVIRIVGTMESAEDVKVYPNPVSDHIRIYNPKGDAAEIVVMDLAGNIVKQERILGVREQSINLSPLSAGVYLMRIRSRTGSRVIKIFRE